MQRREDSLISSAYRGHEIRTHEEAYQKSSKLTRRAAFEKAQKALELLTVDLK